MTLEVPLPHICGQKLHGLIYPLQQKGTAKKLFIAKEHISQIPYSNETNNQTAKKKKKLIEW